MCLHSYILFGIIYTVLGSEMKNMESIRQKISNQFAELEDKLKFIKNQLKKDKEKLNNHNLFIELNKSRNFFTEHIINKIEKNINTQDLIKESDNSINIVEKYIKDIENIKKEMSKDKKYDVESLKSVSSSLNNAISNISPLCSNSSNEIYQLGEKLSYGGGALVIAGLASCFFCPLLTIPLMLGGAVSCTASIPIKAFGSKIESIKNKIRKIF